MNPSTFSVGALSDEDTLYLKNVMIDLQTYIKIIHSHSRKNIVLLFPPVNNFRRFLIHHLVDNTFRTEKLNTLSVGNLYARRTVVYPSALKPMDVKCTDDVVPERRSITDKKVNTLPLYRPPALRKNEIENSSPRKERKTKKPDMQIYVPRGRRLLETGAGEDPVANDECNKSTSSPPKSHNVETLQTPKKKKIISASNSSEKPKNDENDLSSLEFTPVIVIPAKKSKDDRSVENITHLDGKNAGSLDDVGLNASDGLPSGTTEFNNSVRYIEEMESINLTGYNAPETEDVQAISSSNYVDTEAKTEIPPLVKMKENGNDTSCLIIHKGNNDECPVEEKLKDYVEEIVAVATTSPTKQEKKLDVKIVSEKTPSHDESPPATESVAQCSTLSVSECEWDELFDEEGEYVDKGLINELMTAIGKVSVQHAARDYKPFQTCEERSSDGGCVVEIYGFPAEFKTDDLSSVFASYRSDPGFQIVWVDDTHALAVFSSPILADEVLNTELPFVKTRPIKNAMPKSRTKAQTFISPPVSRPKTCVSLARRLVSGHLGMKINVTDQQRAAERKILSDAREKRRLVAKQKQDAWEGTS